MDENLAWRNHAADWHLQHGMPDCGCDDDTPDGELCQPSREHAARMCADLPKDDLDGPPDVWNHDVWVAAWGHNATLVMNDRELHGMPPAPAGMMWLVTRLLTRGRKAAEVVLVRLGENASTTLGRSRCLPDPESIATRARQMLQRLTG